MMVYPKCYGEVMRPLDVAELPDYLQAAYAASPLFREWLHLSDKVRRAKKVSSWTEWTPELHLAYDEGFEAFSRLRGYSEEEIADFGRYLVLTDQVDAEQGDGDFTCCAAYEIHQVTRTQAFYALAGHLVALSAAAT
jgi:hypothetical protein